MAKQPRSLQGKVVVVTGGARGIGACTAGVLGRLGAKVAIGDLDEGDAQAAAKDVSPEAIGLRLDVTERAGFTAFLDEVERRLGPIDILINNAGIMPLAELEREDDAMTTRQLEINLHAVIHGTREAARRMRPRGTGHIVNVASAAGKAGFPGGATYCATKHGVVGLSEAMYFELRDSGVDVSVVLPAVVRTELAAGLNEARGVSSVLPEDVAKAIATALRFPRFEVFVPQSAGMVQKVSSVLPRKAAEWIMRTMGADQLLLSAVNSTARADYESRVAAGVSGEREPTE
ncbi:SDR family oxidoreductase [Tamaricihabitans halophyticus]|uniref:SDR family oxidoreductase n=1 Tax=Tamaricihabitans halophyticus TaxID=1262583 RepID=UPI0010431DCE|nr:SDR family oxidoreductase [Tamaricihabitans halophyticus]